MRTGRTPAPGSSIMAGDGAVPPLSPTAARYTRVVTRDFAPPGLPTRPRSPVVVNCRFLTRPVTGVERFAEELTTRLVDLRDDILLVAPTGQLRKTEIGGQPVHRVGRLRGHLWEQTELPRFAHRHGNAMMLNLANTGPAFSREQIVAIHDINHRRNPASFSWRFRTLYRALTPLLVRSAAAVVTVSQFSKREIATYYGRADGVFVIPNAVGEWVHVPGQQPAGVSDDEFFLLVGSPSAHKNMEVAIAGFLRYRSSGGRARLILAGSAHHSLAATTADAVDEVQSIGRVADDELAWLYQHCKAFLFPSTYEGFGIPPIEAQAVGAPVLASDIPALREVLTPESALWFAPGEPAQIADALAIVDNDPARIARISKEGRRNADRFSWPDSASALSELIDRIYDGKRNAR
jgi:glycosyltransferase involved in cell wall biosynthesis